jgi:hypothetical protein
MLAGGAAFAVGTWWVGQPFAPSTPAVAIAVTVMAAWILIRAPRGSYAIVMAGLLAGLWTGVLRYQGLPLPAAALIAAGVPIVSARLRTRRTAFAPPALREEALLFMVILGVVAAAAPGISDGWRAATNLNLQGAGSEQETVIPMWTLLMASVALVSGGLFSLWSRR